ncbi:MAG: zinc ribbon domain-containing protein [Burkholderiales bacterium]|nr:zinc ribbon domain-containing protein [Burkholderiales bacterium]
MPTYDYQCTHCGPFEAMRRMADRDAAAACPQCGAQAGRILVSAPHLADMASDVRFAMATNEKSRHEPKLSSSLRHPKGCGCCSTSSRKTAPTAKSFANRRPWMISH